MAYRVGNRHRSLGKREMLLPFLFIFGTDLTLLGSLQLLPEDQRTYVSGL